MAVGGAADVMSLILSTPRLVADGTNSTGPWYDKVNRLTDTHAVGRVGARTIATVDGGRSWTTIAEWLNETGAFGGIYAADGASFHNGGDRLVLTSPTGKNYNVTGATSEATTRFFVGGDGQFVRDTSGPFSIAGLPNLHGFRAGSAASTLWLHDGSMLATVVTSGVGAARSGYLSVVALHSGDAGYSWTFSGVVASADEVLYAHEGPSENALARLANGSVLCVMRVEGESGHHSPYISKLSDDGGHTWAHLRPLAAWPGAADAPGCVRPRIVTLNGSLVLAGGRPNPASHDILVWLNAAGDGEAWEPYSVSYWHNRLATNESWKMPTNQINCTGHCRLPRYTTSYTSFVRTGTDSAFVLYGAAYNAFAMPIRLGSARLESRTGLRS